MRKTIMTLVVLSLISLTAQGQEELFDQWFDGGTLRLDCLREGSAEGDTLWVERWIDRQAPWHGSVAMRPPSFDNGEYRVVMRDMETRKEIYSYNYNTLFGEYKHTPEGRTVKKRFEETVLLPRPRKAVLIIFQKRNEGMYLDDQTTVRYDPRRPREKKQDTINTSFKKLHTVAEPKDAFDIAFVMQGFDDASEKEFNAACLRMMKALFAKEPFHAFMKHINVYAVKGDAGVEYNTFGADRYAMTEKVHQLHDLLGTTPCDHIIICINNEKYGGGAIYNFYSVTSMHSMAESVLPHELGHGIGGLADEYVDEDLSYAEINRTATEPLEPNITNLVHFERKWKKMLPKNYQIPSPELEVPKGECGPLGVYEGAGYSQKGVYRPTLHCMMRDYARFCPVCHKRLTEVFNYHLR